MEHTTFTELADIKGAKSPKSTLKETEQEDKPSKITAGARKDSLLGEPERMFRFGSLLSDQSHLWSRSSSEESLETGERSEGDRLPSVGQSDLRKGKSSPEHIRLAANNRSSPEHPRHAATNRSSPEHLRLAANNRSSPEHPRHVATNRSSPEHTRLAATNRSSPEHPRLSATNRSSPEHNRLAAASRSPPEHPKLHPNSKRNQPSEPASRNKIQLPVAIRDAAPTGKVLKKKDMEFCKKHTRFDEEKITKWFKSFRKECPNGKLSRNHLLHLFRKVFPGGNGNTFCTHIFRIFDSDGNNFLDFKEFLMAIDISQCTDMKEKLEWAFRMYDVDGSGTINIEEMTNIISTMDELEGGRNKEGWEPPENRAEELIYNLDENGDGNLTKEEFVEGYLRLLKSNEVV